MFQFSRDAKGNPLSNPAFTAVNGRCTCLQLYFAVTSCHPCGLLVVNLGASGKIPFYSLNKHSFHRLKFWLDIGSGGASALPFLCADSHAGS